MYGVIDFYKECKKNGIKPIIGSEFYVSHQDLHIKNDTNKERNHLILLAKNNVGYKNLCRLITEASENGTGSAAVCSRETLSRYSEGLSQSICSGAS